MKVPSDTSSVEEEGLIDSSDSFDQDSAQGGVSDPSGVSGYFNYKLEQVSCPQCFGHNTELTVSAYAEFHEPISDYHTAWKLDAGQCSQNINITSVSANSVSYGSSIEVAGLTNSFSMPIQNDNSYFTNALYESNYNRDALHSVTLQSDSFIFESIHGFDYIEPYTMLYIDPSYAFAAPIYKSGATFTWGPSGSDSNFEITLDVYSTSGSSFLGTVTCVSEDDGHMVIPGQYLEDYQQGSLVAIYLNRSKVSLSEFEGMNSYIETHMEWQVVGTGYIQ